MRWRRFSLVNLAYEISENNKVSFNFIAVQTAEDEARRLRGQNDTLGTVPGESFVDQSILHWTERGLLYYQLKGEHDFPEWNDVEVDWVGSLSSTSQDEPDHRIFQYFGQPGDPNNPNDDFYGADGPSQPQRPTRVFRSLEENNMSFRTDVTVPFPSYNTKENKFKTGAAISTSDRAYDSRVFDVRQHGNHPFRRTGDPNDYLATENLDFIRYYNFPANFTYAGDQTIDAVYGMVDWSTFEWLRLTGGARLERTDIAVDTVNLGKNNERFAANIQSTDLLPSLAATVSIRTNLLFRAAWSQTVVRPTYREISRAEIYDVAQSRTIRGNQDLTMSSSRNYDARLEWYPKPGDIMSVGVFYKQIDKPIEQASETRDNSIIFFDNFEQAEVMGVEAEMRHNLGSLWNELSEFEIGINYAYIVSEVPLTAAQRFNRRFFDDKSTRPLYDQPEYVVNGDISWNHEATGTVVTLSGGVVGRRLTLVGLAIPDDFLEPAPQLDFFISQRFAKRWKAKFSAKNLLDPVQEVTQEWPVGSLPISSYTKGMSFGLSVDVEF